VTSKKRRRERILAEPPEADFDDVTGVLTDHGWRLDRERGSHAVFTKPGEYPITVPKVGGRRVKRTYLRLIIERLGLDRTE
jgi:predicted RNA binding protein YcfA (HicA-like mRNA interferase family)